MLLESVVEMTKAGYSAAAIARSLHITERSVVRLRRRAGISQPLTAGPLSEAEKELALGLLADGCSYGEVGRTLGRPTETIRRRFPGYGWDRATTDAFSALLRRHKIRMARHEGVFIK